MPVASPDFALVVPDSPVAIRLLDNDQGEGLVLVSVGAPAHGSIAVNPDQSVTYTPASGFSGEDSFSYSIRDAAGGTAESIVSLLVNAAPIAVDDSVTTVLATPVTVPVLANDIDPEGQPLSLVEVAGPGHGTVTMQPGQSLLYQPQHDFTGIDSFSYSISDIHGTTATAVVRVTVADSNAQPVAMPDAVTTAMGTPVTIQVVANDHDPDGDPLSLTGVTLPGHGILFVNPDRSIVYAPAAGYTGEDEFTYTVSDGRGGTAVGSVSIMVERPNSAPVAANDAFTVAADTPTTLHLLANDSDPDGDTLTLVGLSMPQHGTLSTNPDQSVTYTPSAGFSGEDEFTYTISDGRGGTAVGEAKVTVQPPPALPTFANDYAWRRRLVIPPRPASAVTLTNFVLYVDVTADWLRTRALGGRVESAQGFDLCFELEDGTPLAHEVDLYDGAAENGAKGRLAAWVRLPSWATAQQLRLFLYYGKPGLAASTANSAAVWAGYLAVWDVRSGADRSGQGRNLTMSGVIAQPLLGGAGAFDGAGAHGRRTTAEGVDWLGGLSAMTVQAVVRSNVTGQRRGIIAQGPLAGTDANSSLLLAYVDAPWANGATQSIQFQWRNDAGSNFIVSRSNKQTTSRQVIHATWSQGQAPRLYLDGVEEATPAASGAAEGTGVTPNGDLWLGVATGPLNPASTGWSGLIDEVRIRPDVLSAQHVATEAANQGDPAAFYGIGGEEGAVGTVPAAVALPLTATTRAGQRIDLDVVAAAFVPGSGSPVTLTAVRQQPANGLATIIGGKLRYTPNAGYIGPDSIIYDLTDALGRTSTGKVSILVVAQSTTWAGPRSKLFWHASGYGEQSGATLDALEQLRTNPVNGKVRGIDLVGLFSPPGLYSATDATSMRSFLNSKSWTGSTIASKTDAGLNIAWRGFPTSTSNTPPSAWPAQNGSVSGNTGILLSHNISPRFPVGYTDALKNDNTTLGGCKKKQQGMDVWRKASLGWFDHIWRWQMQNLKTGFLDFYGLTGRRLIFRPFWEFDAFVGGTAFEGYGYGIQHNISTSSTSCIRSTSNLSALRSAGLLTGEENNAETDGGQRQPIHDLQLVQAGMRRWVGIMREEIPNSFAHICPLRRGGASGPYNVIDIIVPEDWDIIGPDYYDVGLNNVGEAYGNGTNEDRWNQHSTLTGIGPSGLGIPHNPAGIVLWINYFRQYCLPLNPNARFGLGEWGVTKIPSPFGGPGGDNPVFINKMYETFADNADILGYESYFNSSEHALLPSGGPLPQASAAFREKWGTLA